MRAPDVFPRVPLGPGASHGIGRRCFDIFAAFLGLVLLAPLMAIIAAAITCESGLPILFRQWRIGMRGKPFQMYKFRKFHQICDGPALTEINDVRFTRIGKLLALTKLDELPQLWNVLRGEMAVVGPRPESFEFSGCYQCGFEEALQYKPGLVGPSQVFFRHEASQYPAGENPTHFYRQVIFPIKAGIDIAYFRDRTFLSDFLWIWRSGKAIFGWKNWEPNLRCGSLSL